MSRITVYESLWCGYCRAARRLLEKKGWPFESVVVDGKPAVRAQMREQSGRSSVPQIFFGEQHIGGFDDLAELEATGELDKLYAELHGTASGTTTHE